LLPVGHNVDFERQALSLDRLAHQQSIGKIVFSQQKN
jgi:hypothetical protein